MEQSYVILKDVRKTYHMGEVSINAVDGVNFEIKKGDHFIIPFNYGEYKLKGNMELIISNI